MITHPSKVQMLWVGVVLVAGFSALHWWLAPPWFALKYGEIDVALGTWAVAPCTFAAVALLLGGVESKSRREYPFSSTQCQMLAALLPLFALATIAALREPLVSAPEGWMSGLLPVSLAVGAGLALCALFWQGVVQLRLPDSWPGILRVVAVTALSSAIWLPFVVQDAAADGDILLWIDLVILAATAAIIFELGMSTRVVVGLAGFAGAFAVFLHAPSFL